MRAELHELAVFDAHSFAGAKGTTSRRYVLFADERRKECACLTLDGCTAVDDTT